VIRRSWVKDPRKIFIGWWLTIAAGILCLWGYGYQAYGFSALLKPLEKEFGWSRAAISVAASIGRFEGGVEGPAVGYVSDRWGPRTVIFFGIIVLGAGLVLMNYTNSLWTFYLFWGVLVTTGANIALSIPQDTAIANWFIRRRGTAMGIRWVFSGLSGVIVLPLVAWFIVRYGWRMACVIGGVTMWSIGLPLAWFLIKPRRPEYYGLLPDGGTIAGDTTESIEAGIEYAAETGEVEFTLRQAMTTRALWLIITAYMFHGMLGYVMMIHCVPYLTDRGLDPIAAAATMSIYVAASIPARLLGGILADRVGLRTLRYLIAGSYLLQTLGVVIFLANQSMPFLYVFFILYGFGMGAPMPMTPLLRARYFGRKAYGSIYGVSSLMYMPAGVAGPVLAGWIWDTTGSYMLVFTLLAVALGIAAVAILLATPPKPPEEISDITKRL